MVTDYQAVKRYRERHKPRKEITTNFLEDELMKLYKEENDQKIKSKLLDQMIDLWKWKHKIPQEAKSDKKLDLSKLRVTPDATPTDV